MEGIAKCAADLDSYWGTEAAQKIPQLEHDFETPPGFADLTPVGHGGMGVVYSALDKKSNERVAIKVGKTLGANSDFIKREFRTLAKIRHPNLVVLKELHQFNDSVFFSMEHVEGDSFNSKSVTQKKEGAPWLPDQLADLCCRLLELAGGIDFLHRNGYAHCDIKPSNILVTPTGRVVILDLGLAQSFQRQRRRQDQGFGGTSAYMSPEQASGEPPRAASDWFSFGVVMFETLFGCKPFQGDPLDVLFDKLVGNAAAPSLEETGVEQSLSNLCLSLLNPDPSERPVVEEIRQCLECFCKEPTVSPRTPAAQIGFYGRRQELRQLNRRLVDSRNAPKPTLVFVEGDSGMGKTHLIQKFLEDCRNSAQSIVLSGRCYENERIPYKAIDAVIGELAIRWRLHDQPDAVSGQLINSIGAVFKGFSGSVDSQHEVSNTSQTAEEGLSAVLKALSSGGKNIIIFIDDVQWADADSGELLCKMIRDVPLLLICSHRRMQRPNQFITHLSNELSGTLQRGRTLPRVKVGPFSDQDAERFLDRNFPSLSKQVLDKAIEASDGVPMFLTSLAEQLCTMPADQIESNSLDWARELGPKEKRLLQFVCASGYPLPQSIALQAAEISYDLEASVSDLSSRRLVTLSQSDGEVMLTPFHDMIREAIYSKLDAAERKTVHASIATVCEDKPDVLPDRLAFHFREAGDRAKCCHYSIAAGDVAAKSRAFAEAVRAYKDAREHFVGSDKEKQDLQQKLAASLGQLGQSSEAGDLYFELAALEDGGHQFLQQAAYQYCAAGRIEDALQGFDRLLKPWGYKTFDAEASVLWRLLWLRLKQTVSDKTDWFKSWNPMAARRSGVSTGAGDGDAVATSPMATPLDEHASDDNRLCDLLWDVGIAFSFFDMTQACLFSYYSQQVARRGGDETRILRANIWRASHEAMFGSSKKRLVKKLLDSTDTPTTKGIPYLAGMHSLAKGMSAHFFGDWETAVEKCVEAEELLSADFDDLSFYEVKNGIHLDQMGISTAQLNGLLGLQYSGKYKEMTARYYEFLSAPANRDHLLNKSNLMIFVGTYACLVSDRPVDACSLLDEALKMWPVDKLCFQQIIAEYIRVEAYLYSREYRLALDAMEDLWKTVSRSNYIRFESMRVFIWELRGRCAVGQFAIANKDASEKTAAEKIVRRAIKILEREKLGWARAMGQKIRGSMELEKKNFQAAEAAFVAARDGFERAKMQNHKHTTEAKLCEITGQLATDRCQKVSDWFVSQEIKNSQAFTEMHHPRWTD